jgi:GntR family transcriptional repressor for pyruvate dehydrogenase complex
VSDHGLTSSKKLFPRIPREPRLSDKVAEALLRTITTQGLRPGERLPSERELGEQFGVSRTVIREAVRALAAKGLIEAQTGSGLRVSAVDAATVSQSMNLYLRGRDSLDYAKINEVRQMIEVQVAGLAAERATDAQIASLREVCERMGAVLHDVDRASVADVAFHRALAACADNELYLVMLDSIEDVLLEIRRATLGIPGRPEKGLRAHRRILARVAAHDPARAREAMRAHLAESETAWRRLDGARRRS